MSGQSTLPSTESLAYELLSTHGRHVDTLRPKGGVDVLGIAQDLGFTVSLVPAVTIDHKHGDMDLETMDIKVDRRLNRFGRKQVIAILIAHSLVDLDEFREEPELKSQWIRSFANQLTMPPGLVFALFASGMTPRKMARMLEVTVGQLATRLDELGLLD